MALSFSANGLAVCNRSQAGVTTAMGTSVQEDEKASGSRSSVWLANASSVTG